MFKKVLGVALATLLTTGGLVGSAVVANAGPPRVDE